MVSAMSKFENQAAHGGQGYRLGIDIGCTSLGWCLLGLDDQGRPNRIAKLGVRLFSSGRDPHNGTSLAVDRRNARCERRRRDRYLVRRRDLMAILIRSELMPPTEFERKSLEKLDPYELRARGLDQELTPHEFGRALFHLHQRRGFNSNRRVLARDNLDPGKIKGGAMRLRELMNASGARTIGEFLYKRRLIGEPVRARLNGIGPKASYEFFAERFLVKEEFEELWERQARWTPILNDTLKEELLSTIFRQRPLKPFEPGKCSLDPAKDLSDRDGLRVPRALPLAQRFRILSELANLRIKIADQPERKLTDEEYNALRQKLFRGGRISFSSIKKMFNMGEADALNLESGTRDHLLGDATAAILGKRGLFGPHWHDYSLSHQNEIVERLLNVSEHNELIEWLQGYCNLESSVAETIVHTALPDGYARLGKRALNKLVGIMEKNRFDYAEACFYAGYHQFQKKKKCY